MIPLLKADRSVCWSLWFRSRNQELKIWSNKTRLVVVMRRRLALIVVQAKPLFGVVAPPVLRSEQWNLTPSDCLVWSDLINVLFLSFFLCSRFVTRVGSETGRRDEELKIRSNSRRNQIPAAAAIWNRGWWVLKWGSDLRWRSSDGSSERKSKPLCFSWLSRMDQCTLRSHRWRQKLGFSSSWISEGNDDWWLTNES